VSDTGQGTPTVGRPRRFDDETERRLLIKAADRVMARKGYKAISLGDVLDEAGLSTRAFYRHFGSKVALVEALLLRESESFGRALARAVSRANDPVAAVEAWLDRFLDAFYESRRARRAAQLNAAAIGESGPSAEMVQELRQISCAPLVEALRAGHDAGVLYSPTPEADAYSIHDLVTASRQASDIGFRNREAMRAHVVRFAWPALRLELRGGAE
jgi:AcrR family transcriptional regulator